MNDQVDQVTELETHAHRQAAGVEEPAEYAAHQEPPQNADAVGVPWAVRIGGKAPSSRKKASSSKGRRSSAPRKSSTRKK